MPIGYPIDRLQLKNGYFELSGIYYYRDQTSYGEFEFYHPTSDNPTNYYFGIEYGAGPESLDPNTYYLYNISLYVDNESNPCGGCTTSGTTLSNLSADWEWYNNKLSSIDPPIYHIDENDQNFDLKKSDYYSLTFPSIGETNLIKNNNYHILLEDTNLENNESYICNNPTGDGLTLILPSGQNGNHIKIITEYLNENAVITLSSSYNQYINEDKTSLQINNQYSSVELIFNEDNLSWNVITQQPIILDENNNFNLYEILTKNITLENGKNYICDEPSGLILTLPQGEHGKAIKVSVKELEPSSLVIISSSINEFINEDETELQLEDSYSSVELVYNENNTSWDVVTPFIPNAIKSSNNKIISEEFTNSNYEVNYLSGNIHNFITNMNGTINVTNIPVGEKLIVRVNNSAGYEIQFNNKKIINNDMLGTYYLTFINVIGQPELIGGALSSII